MFVWDRLVTVSTENTNEVWSHTSALQGRKPPPFTVTHYQTPFVCDSTIKDLHEFLVYTALILVSPPQLESLPKN